MLWTQASARYIAATGLALGMSTQTPAQQTPAPARVPTQATKRQPSIIVEVRDPSGQRVADATGWLRLEPSHRLAALPLDLPTALLPGLPRTTETTAQSDARGILRLPTEQSSAGSGMVTTKAGLGALLPRSHSQRANRVTLQPLAELTTSTGSEPFALVARSTMPDGSQVTLPLLVGRKVWLPAGDYEIWASSTDGLIWRRLSLQPGTRHALQFAGAAQRLRLAPDAYVYPAGMASLSLRKLAQAATNPATDGIIALRGNALAAPIVSWIDGVVTPAQVTPTPTTTEPLSWPVVTTPREPATVIPLVDTAPAETSLIGLVRNQDRSYRIMAYAPNNGGVLRMPPRPPGDAWLLLIAPGRAATAFPWVTPQANDDLAPPTGQPFELTARDQNNLPIADLYVSFSPFGQDAAEVIARRVGLPVPPKA